MGRKKLTVEDYFRRWFWYRVLLPQSCMTCKKLLEGGCWGLSEDEGFIIEFTDFERKLNRFGSMSQGSKCTKWE